ncbi:MAG: tRNA preQ1(34) S-adenosylmethionine ribosyltransferase-isomerase QueA [Nitrospiraceae bacterium]|nr:MAG: tRNA preQ1(34) S-adenosylmethionine ribosyltransferase-isomerase QueA [Nitrospiraceae bacterium]
MKLSDFDYSVPENQIAQQPLNERDASRLFVLDRKTEKAVHRLFRDITDYLCTGDVLVLNNTKVIPARLTGYKPSGGKAEITLLKELKLNSWEALVKGVHEGRVILECGIVAQVSRLNGTLARVDFELPSSQAENKQADIKGLLNDLGVMPLPLYIKREAAKADSKQYQTVYAERDGAVAAPTAGLHFTDNLLSAIKDKGINVQTITLHVGYGTFKPVKVRDIRDHKMEAEYYEISETAASAVNTAKAEGRRVIAVGTTVTRALETSANHPIPSLVRRGKGGVKITPGQNKTSIFIYPGYEFRIVDGLITNFHLPGSTPMMLAAAFSGLSLLKKAYSIAQVEGYRFYSYGDAMLMF